MIGEVIRKLRSEKKLSVRALAELAGVSKSTLSDIENGNNSPSINTIQKIADVLKISLETLFSEEKLRVEYTKKEKGISNNLTIVNKNGQFTVDSREVAEMVQKRHADLLRDIKGYKTVIDQSANLRSADFFIEDKYSNENNQFYPCFLLTKKGCDMVANKMTGEKGILFTAEYVTRFEEMEKGLYANTQKLNSSYFYKFSARLREEMAIEISSNAYQLYLEAQRANKKYEESLELMNEIQWTLK